MSSSNAKVLSHRWLTSSRLLERLSSAPVFSIIIVGIAREKMIAKIMPGIMNAISPSPMSMPVIMLTASSERSFAMVKLKLDRRSAWPFSRVSLVNFMLIPWVIWPMIHPMMPTRNALAKTAEIYPPNWENHCESCSGVGFGGSGVSVGILMM